jgi:lysophospholipase L1-like esterase
MIWNEIVCLGDSLTYGARDRFGRSFPAELGRILYEKTGEFYICHNYGVNGHTSSDLQRRAWGHLKSNPGARIATLLIGTNDTKSPTCLEVYKDNLRQIIMSCKAHGKIVFLGTLPALGFSPYYIKNTEYINKYNKVIKDLSKEYDCVICDLSNLEKFLIDGVHFTYEGNLEIASRFAEAILSV